MLRDFDLGRSKYVLIFNTYSVGRKHLRDASGNYVKNQLGHAPDYVKQM